MIRTAAVLSGLVVVLSGCGHKAAVPDVVGVRLDSAHDQLAAASFDDVDDRDYFEDRMVLLDSNRVVLAQDPGRGTTADGGAKVTLRVGKISESRTAEHLPENSPVLAQLRATASAEAAKKQQADAAAAASRAKTQAEQAARALTYVNQVDPVLRMARDDLHQFAVVAGRVRSGKLGGDALVSTADGLVTLVNEYEQALKVRTPDDDTGRTGAHAALLSSLETFKQAALTLLSADGADRADSLQRFDDVYASSRAGWNKALASTYDSTSVQAPLLD